MQPEISVIVPVYNMEKCICKCVDSILSQSFEDFEVILINDGSQDNSGKICDNYAVKDKRVKVIHTENMGVSSAKNTGLEMAIGKYICFIDSDDFVEDCYLSTLYKCLAKGNCDLVITGVKNGDIKKPDQYHTLLNIKEQTLLRNDYINNLADLLNESWLNFCHGKMFKADILKKNNIKFKCDVNLGEDTMLVFDYIKCTNSIYVFPQHNYIYMYYGNNSLAFRVTDDRLSKLLYICSYIEETAKAMNIYNEQFNRIMARRKVYAGINCIRNIIIDENSSLSLTQKYSILKKILEDNDIRQATKLLSKRQAKDITYGTIIKVGSPILCIVVTKLFELLNSSISRLKQILK